MIRTRFAPSPTGYLHIGGARTALFSWLYAKKHGGQFILRVEDTDRERSTQEAVDAIFAGMEWLGLTAEEGPFYQTQRFGRYKEVMQQLLDDGKAYHCYCSKERLEQLREDQMAAGSKPRYDRCCLNREGAPPEGVDPVVRFLNPTEGSVVVDDQIKGAVVFDNAELDDLIIARSDGSPTYNFCVVVDDLDMQVTHVVRGDDHLNNTPRQINILTALGANPPRYAHVPMILGDDGQKLSKRHGAVGVMQYRDDGFLPEAVLNYLVRLGWSHGDQEDRFKAEVFEDRVYVMTPMGKVMDLPQGATPLDFAYYVHTDIGHRCRGAKIDGHIVPLTHELTNGDSVEILTSKRGIPSRDWLSPHLGYLNTPRARAKVRSWFRHRDHDQNLVSGRALFDKELHRLGVEKFDKKSLLTRFNYHKFDDFLAAIGHGEISTAQLANAVDMPVQALPRQQPRHKRGHAKRLKSDEIWVQGVGDLLTQIAKCCKPVPKEPIVGYITQGRGVTIHRHDCSSLLRMQKSHQERLIEVSWGGDTRSSYPVDMLIIAYDRRGLLSDISMLLSNESINVNSVNTLTDRHDNMAHMTISMEISDLAQLSRVLDKIGQLRNVVEVKRRT